MSDWDSIIARSYKHNQRFGLLDVQASDFTLFDTFLTHLNDHSLDFAHSFRLLSRFESADSGTSFQALLDDLLPQDLVPSYLHGRARETFTEWFKVYEERLVASEREHPECPPRAERIKASNPRFVLRQWILEEVISRLERKSKDNADPEDGQKFLERVLEMSVRPFDSWGEEGGKPAEDEERKRLCGLGDKTTWGFQCSCSS
jgi:serine/tyrosine/threonine adenylyltransferase